MADSALHKVWDSLVTALEAIRSDDGYHHTVATVTPDLVSLMALPAPRTPALMVLHDGETSLRTFRLGSYVEDRFAFLVEGRIDAPGLTSGEKAGAYADLVADLERAVTRDPTRGGVANHTYVRGTRGPYCGLDAGGMVLFQARLEVIVVREVGES